MTGWGYSTSRHATPKHLAEQVAEVLRQRGIEPVIQTAFYPSTHHVKGMFGRAQRYRAQGRQNRIPIMTTLHRADAALRAIKSMQGSEVQDAARLMERLMVGCLEALGGTADLEQRAA